MTGFTLIQGVTIHVKFSNANSADNPKLKFNGEADANAKAIMQYGTTAIGSNSETNGWYAGAVVSFTYDGTNWIRDQGFNTNSQSAYGNITTNGQIGSGNNLVVTNSGTVQAGATIISAISSQTQNTRFLREDGTWAAPSYSDLSNLSLPGIMHFIGISSTAITNGGVENPTIDGASISTHEAGDIVIYGTAEYIWTAQSKWALLGDENSYALKSHSHGNITSDGKMNGSTIIEGSAVAITHKFLREDGTWVIPKYTDAYTLPIAKYNALGGVKPAYSTSGSALLTTTSTANTASPTITARSTTNGRYYAIEADKDGILYVNVPWTDHYNWTDLLNRPNRAASSTDGGGASTVEINGAIPASSGISGYLLYGAAASGDEEVKAQSTLYIYNLLSGDAISQAQLNIGASRVKGILSLHTSGNNSYTGDITVGTLTETRTYTLPDESGTIALTTDLMNPASHKHGNIENNGTLQTNDVTIANGDKIIVTDYSDSAKIARTSISFDGTTIDKALSQKGTWESFNNYTHPTGDGNSHVPATSTNKQGLYLRAGATEDSAAWAAPTVWHGTCNTAAATLIKDVTCPSFPKGNELEAGTVIFVYFNNTNSGAVGSIKLRVNSNVESDAKPIKYLYNNDVPADIPGADYLKGGQTYYFSYDGSNWVVRMMYNTDTTPYGIRVYRDTVSDSAFNDDYPLLISRSLASDIYSPYTNDIYAIINNSNVTKIPTYNPNTGELKATKFIGAIEGSVTGTADVALKLTTSNLGTVIKPIYLVAGEATECNTYAGGTAITLNETNKSSTTASFYAPLDVGTQYQILVSGGSTNKTPVWTEAALLQSEISNSANTAAYTVLTLGNDGNAASPVNHSEGKIVLYSAQTEAHTIDGASTAIAYTHTLPNNTGWLASGGVASGTVEGVADGATLMYLANTGILTASTSDVGGTTQPVYLAAGVITAIEYTANRLYYTASTISLEAGTYYADGTGLAINKTSLTNNYILEVNGKTKLLDNLDITGDIAPTATNAYALGIGGNTPKRWSALYIGTANTYGSNTQPIYWNDGVPEALTYTQNRIYYSASSTSFEAATCYCDGSSLTINGTSAPANTGIFQVLGTSTMQHILPDTTITYDLGSSSLIWSSLYIQTIAAHYIEAGPSSTWSDKTLYLGYGNTNQTTAIKMYYSGAASTHTEFFEINNNGAYALTRFGVNGQNTSYNFYVNGSSYFNGAMQFSGDLTFDATGSTGTSKKIVWSGSGDGAEIYYYVPTAEQGNLVLNTKDDANCMIALAASGSLKMYLNPTNTTFYPATTNSGSLGLGGTSAKRWSAVYIGTADSYGAYGYPVYWNAGVPAQTFPVQYTTWSIASGGTSTGAITKTGKYFADTYVIALVVTSGEANLNGPLTWTTAADTLTITTSAATSGAVSGYVLTARADSI